MSIAWDATWYAKLKCPHLLRESADSHPPCVLYLCSKKMVALPLALVCHERRSLMLCPNLYSTNVVIAIPYVLATRHYFTLDILFRSLYTIRLPKHPAWTPINIYVFCHLFIIQGYHSSQKMIMTQLRWSSLSSMNRSLTFFPKKSIRRAKRSHINKSKNNNYSTTRGI